jgi:hypothetical protein
MPPKRLHQKGRKRGLPGIPALALAALKDVRRAHSLLEKGQHENAAQLFERQARDAADRGKHLPAAHLYLQAGRARLLTGDTTASEQLLYEGLGILAASADRRRLALSGNQFIEDLENLGQDQLALDVRAWLEQTLELNPGAVVGVSDASDARTRPSIQCPQCQAFLRPADIEQWETWCSHLCILRKPD